MTVKKNLLIAAIFGFSLVFTTQSMASSKGSFNCAKKTCSQMKSCAEARYKLKQCGHKKLDRDRDGIPCEKICGD